MDVYLPKVTIIVAVFNGAATLERCLKSITVQSHRDKELIVMDGGSTDESVKILEGNTHAIDYWESKTDRGIYHAWNKAVSHATGEWICFLGADDYFWQYDVLERMVPSLQQAQRRGIRLVYGRVTSVNKRNEVQNILGMPWYGKKSIHAHQMPPHPGLFHHMDIFNEKGNFDESFRIAADYDLLLRELSDRAALFVPKIIVAGMQCGGISCNRKHLLRLFIEDAFARKKNGLRLITFPVLRYYSIILFNTLIAARGTKRKFKDSSMN